MLESPSGSNWVLSRSFVVCLLLFEHCIFLYIDIDIDIIGLLVLFFQFIDSGLMANSHSQSVS